MSKPLSFLFIDFVYLSFALKDDCFPMNYCIQCSLGVRGANLFSTQHLSIFPSIFMALQWLTMKTLSIYFFRFCDSSSLLT